MAEQREQEGVGRDQLIVGEDDRSDIQAQEDAALLVSRCRPLIVEKSLTDMLQRTMGYKPVCDSRIAE